MPSYFDITAGLPDNKLGEYRFYKCLKNTCKRVATNDQKTVNIPSVIPISLDKYILRYHLKTFFPISIS